MMSLFASFDMSIFSFSAFFLLWMMLSGIFISYYSLFSYHIYFLSESMSKFIFMFQKTKKNLPEFYSCYLMSLFFFIFLLNFFSVGPYTFPLMSQLSLVFCLALLSWLPSISFLFFKNPKGFLYHLVPEGSPMSLIPMLVVIEFISSIIRPLTLTIRLVANTVAGHVLMELYCSLGWKSLILFGFYPLLSLVEMLVALIQAYVFMMMSLLYLSEMA